MAKEAEDNGKGEDESSGDVGCSLCVTGLAPNYGNHDWKRRGGEQHAAGVDANAADPFFEAVAVRLENKPLISEKRERDGEQVSDQAGDNVAVGDERREQHGKQGETSIAQNGIAGADHQVADHHDRARRRLGSRDHDRECRSRGAHTPMRRVRTPRTVAIIV